MPDLFSTFMVWGIILALFAVGAAIKWCEVRQYRHWSTTEGKIVSARSVYQPNDPSDSNYDSSDTELLDVPLVEFEYQVGETILRGSRISMVVADSRYHSAKATLARYPVGKIVPVFFDPENPNNAALERSVTKSDCILFGWLLLISLVVPWLIAVFFYQVYFQVKPRLVDPGAAQVVTGLIGFGTFFLILALGAIATVIRSWFWPATIGRIKSSTVASFRVSRDETHYTSYKPRVLYTYEVDGKNYTSDRISFSFVLGGMNEGKARKIAARYRAKGQVKVYYNPRDPRESVLRRSGNALLLFPILAALFLGVAWALAR
jgi:hypothetical protein